MTLPGLWRANRIYECCRLVPLFLLDPRRLEKLIQCFIKQGLIRRTQAPRIIHTREQTGPIMCMKGLHTTQIVSTWTLVQEQLRQTGRPQPKQRRVADGSLTRSQRAHPVRLPSGETDVCRTDMRTGPNVVWASGLEPMAEAFWLFAGGDIEGLATPAIERKRERASGDGFPGNASAWKNRSINPASRGSGRI